MNELFFLYDYCLSCTLCLVQSLASLPLHKVEAAAKMCRECTCIACLTQAHWRLLVKQARMQLMPRAHDMSVVSLRLLFYFQEGSLATHLSSAEQSTRTAKSMAPAVSNCWHTCSSRIASTAGIPCRLMRVSCRYPNLAFSYTPGWSMMTPDGMFERPNGGTLNRCSVKR